MIMYPQCYLLQTDQDRRLDCAISAAAAGNADKFIMYAESYLLHVSERRFGR